MAHPPDLTPHPRRVRIPGVSWVSLILVIAAVLLAVRGTVPAKLAGLALFFLAFALQAGMRFAQTRMRFVAGPRGVMWNHPQKGYGALAWGEIGALSVREDTVGGEWALILTPLDREAGPSMIAVASELAGSKKAGQEAMLGHLAVILRHLPPGVVIDRQTRSWLGRNGLGGGGLLGDKMDPHMKNDDTEVM